jgi:NSS family neurotransmitter:Na+ symporter
MMGQFGGSAFLVIYIAFVFLFAIPALMGEWALGRETRRGPLGALTAALGPGGRWFGYVLLVTVLVATSYYLVVVANVAYTAAYSLLRGFANSGVPRYHEGLDNGWLQAVIGWAVVGSAMLVLYKGLNRGIERVSKIFVPFFGVVVVYLIVSSLALPNAMTELRAFLRPDFRSLTSTSVFAAMGQAFFSLSLGGTFYLIYGSYLREEEDIRGSAVFTALGDVGAALLAALFIVPTTLIFGLDLETGPRLIFETLPRLFERIPGGRMLGSVFLVALWMVAYLSSLAAFQVLIGALQDSFDFPLGRAVVSVGIVEILLMTPTALHPEFIGVLDLVFGSGMQVLGSAFALVALAWGLGRATTLEQVFRTQEGWWPGFYYHWIRWVVPAALGVTLAMFLIEAW